MSVDDALNTIQQMHAGAEIEVVQIPKTGAWIAEMRVPETWAETGEGATEELAKGALVKKLKDNGRA